MSLCTHIQRAVTSPGVFNGIKNAAPFITTSMPYNHGFLLSTQFTLPPFPLIIIGLHWQTRVLLLLLLLLLNAEKNLDLTIQLINRPVEKVAEPSFKSPILSIQMLRVSGVLNKQAAHFSTAGRQKSWRGGF